MRTTDVGTFQGAESMMRDLILAARSDGIGAVQPMHDISGAGTSDQAGFRAICGNASFRRFGDRG